jgi:hypothetical protein
MRKRESGVDLQHSCYISHRHLNQVQPVHRVCGISNNIVEAVWEIVRCASSIVTSESMHIAIAERRTAVGHQKHYLVKTFRIKAPEIGSLF